MAFNATSSSWALTVFKKMKKYLLKKVKHHHISSSSILLWFPLQHCSVRSMNDWECVLHSLFSVKNLLLWAQQWMKRNRSHTAGVLLTCQDDKIVLQAEEMSRRAGCYRRKDVVLPKSPWFCCRPHEQFVFWIKLCGLQGNIYSFIFVHSLLCFKECRRLTEV